MKTSLDCLPCFVRQALETARFATGDPAVHERIVRDILRRAAEMDLFQPPPVIAQKIHRRLREITGVKDPYRPIKDRFNQMALDLWPELAARVENAPDPFQMAVRLAIAGNVIDSGVNGDLTEAEVRQAVDQVISESFVGEIDEFRRAAAEAADILYLADNAGEIVFDRLLINQLRAARITLAVRGGAVLNDATISEARAAGLHEICEVIDNGSDAQGTILSDCSREFRRRFKEAELVIAKGQGNYETLSDETANVYFLFKVKCPVVASHVGLRTGTQILMKATSATTVRGGD